MEIPRNPVGWFEIYVSDMERARKFYEDTLEVALQKLEGSGVDIEMWAFPMADDSPGAPGALAKLPGMEPGCGGTIIYFSCADCAVTAARATAAGGQLTKEKFSIGPYGFIAFVLDTEGNLIGLHSLE
jgi:hypothetical protein